MIFNTLITLNILLIIIKKDQKTILLLIDPSFDLS
jgi:hypothetical protein